MSRKALYLRTPVLIPVFNLAENNFEVEIYQMEGDINSLSVVTPNQGLTPEELEQYERLVNDKHRYIDKINDIKELNQRDKTELKKLKINYEELSEDDIDSLVFTYENNRIPHLTAEIFKKRKYVESLETELEFYEKPDNFMTSKNTPLDKFYYDYTAGMYKGKELKCLTKGEEDEVKYALEAYEAHIKEDITLADIKIDNEIANRLQRRRDKFDIDKDLYKDTEIYKDEKIYISHDINEEIQNEQLKLNELIDEKRDDNEIISLFRVIGTRNRNYETHKTELDAVSKQLAEISTTKPIGGYYGQNNSNVTD